MSVERKSGTFLLCGVIFRIIFNGVFHSLVYYFSYDYNDSMIIMIVLLVGVIQMLL